MIPDNNCYDFIKKWEGVNLNAYQDSAGVWTIGYGSILYKDHIPVKQGDTISITEAESLLEWEVNLKAIAVNHAVQSMINQNQFNALLSFTYNEGIAALLSSTLLKLVNTLSTDPTIYDAFIMWDKVHVDGKLIVVEGLLTRRKSEANLYFS